MGAIIRRMSLARTLLFSLPPEAAHELALGAVARGLAAAPEIHRAPASLFGIEFPNRLGLAAGFDKNGVGLSHWHKLGFGFVEVGTVTRHPQPGNPKPRLFRLVQDQAIINRMGFNNEGAEALARRIEAAQPQIPIGVNIGKSKITPVEEAAEDYAFSYRLLKDRAAYMVVNVSSPNTPGLRGLQDRAQLSRILWRLKEIDDKPPLFVKLAPDLTPEALAEAAETAVELGLTGLIVSNTTLSRKGLRRDPSEDGGLSGAPLTNLADEALQAAAQAAAGRLTLIASGGVMTPEDARRKRALGADLVQAWTGWVYGGLAWTAGAAKAASEG
jgi:dihydroorotate dehydrogenase